MTRFTLLAVALLTAAGLSVNADDKKPSDKPSTSDPAAMMAAMMKHGTPGDAHKKLESLVGSWTYTGKMWMDPNAPPTDMTGTAERKWILDGRFIQEDVYGDFGGMKFHGIGITGYDNSQKKYVGLWVDNMSTSIMTSEGKLDGKVLTNHGQGFDPTEGKICKTKDVMTIVSNDEQKVVMYKLDGGKEIKTMELNIKRKK